MYGTHKGWVGWGTPIGPAPIRQRRAAYEGQADTRSGRPADRIMPQLSQVNV